MSASASRVRSADTKTADAAKSNSRGREVRNVGSAAVDRVVNEAVDKAVDKKAVAELVAEVAGAAVGAAVAAVAAAAACAPEDERDKRPYTDREPLRRRAAASE